MSTFIKKLYDQNGKETGAILSVVFGAPTNIQQKNIIENRLIQYAFDTLYPGEGLNIYRDMYIDTPSITVIRNINNLPDQKITI
ncbi:hypothetical protein RF683_07400 [Flavobacterium sp. 20NA77.7]|uniref:Uncharacterized protein n=1 Tax=Flavobacterium nakdongensis TaxID=3073563 RepID=A0ABY9R969_9FLAO|nr:hypothetical protein [Flavobacterium sp. 20NA77.7]WMW77314.1 hypothetical protein RF683_07400 [Flavobacterium sp. 20NA77.7]